MLFKLLRRFVTAARAGEHARSHASINTPTHTHALSHPFTRTCSHTHTPEITHLHVVPHQLTCASQVPKPGPAPFPGGGGQGALLSAELSPLPRTSDPPGLRQESDCPHAAAAPGAWHFAAPSPAPGLDQGWEA